MIQTKLQSEIHLVDLYFGIVFTNLQIPLCKLKIYLFVCMFAKVLPLSIKNNAEYLKLCTVHLL